MRLGCHCRSSNPMYGSPLPDGTSCSGKCSSSDFIVTGSVGGFGRIFAGSFRSQTLVAMVPGCSCSS